MQPIPTIKRTSLLAAFGIFFFSSGAVVGRRMPSAEASCPVPSGTGGFANDPAHAAALPGGIAEPGSDLPANPLGSDGTIVFLADSSGHTTGCESVIFEQDNGAGVSLAYDQFDGIGWNADATVLIVEHPAHEVIIEGAHLDVLRDRFREHACETIAATPPPEEANGGSPASDEPPGDANEPYVARVRVVPPDAYHWDQRGLYVSGYEYP